MHFSLEKAKIHHLVDSNINIDFFTLFKLGTKDIELLNNEFKKAYKNYLENQFKSDFLLKKLAN